MHVEALHTRPSLASESPTTPKEPGTMSSNTSSSRPSEQPESKQPNSKQPGTPARLHPTDPTDGGLRSPLGIRWLLVVGASVVAVSVVRLVAAEWQHLAPTLQYLLLAFGAFGVFAAGDVLNRRLRLPVAGSALLALYTVLVPLLAWGAGRQGMLATSLGLVTTLAALLALLAAVPHLLRTTLDLEDRTLPLAFGTMVLAVPLLPWLESLLAPAARLNFFLATSLGLAGVLWWACRHLNRELFHRDRTRFEERTVHLLPFLALVVTYTLACASMGFHSKLRAVPLALASLALMEAGAEYHRALAKALQRPLETWPLRSRALMATGIAGLVISVPLSFYGLIEGAAVVTTLVATRLLIGGVRNRRALDYAAGLGFAVLAYHLVPTLVPAFVRELYHGLLAALGLSGDGAAISLADVGLLALLVAVGRPIQQRLTRTQLRLHGVAVALVGMFALLVALTDFDALRLLVIPTAALLTLALAVLRTPAPLVALYQASILGTLLWTGGLTLEGIDTTGVVVLACTNLAWLLAATWAHRRGLFPQKERLLWGRLAAGPGVLMASLLAIPALFLEPWVGITLWLTGGAVFVLTGPLVRRTQNPTDADPSLTFGLVVMVLATPALGIFRLVEEAHWTPFQGALVSLGLAAFFRFAMIPRLPWGKLLRARHASWILLAGIICQGLSAAFLSFATEPAGNPWLALAPAFLASALFALLAHDDHLRTTTATISASLFAVATTALVYHLPFLSREIFCLGPGLGLLTLATLLRHQLGEAWTSRLVTAGATCLYAMPVWGLLGEVAWGWQALLLVLAVCFGAVAFLLRSRSLLIASSAALAIDLTFFLIELRRAAPSLLWVLGIVFGLTLMALAALLEHRREAFQQRLRVWGTELRTWS